MIQYILTDIEGTTTSVNFVYEVLFPYFSTHFKEFATRNEEEDLFIAQIRAVQQTVETEQDCVITDAEAIEKLLAWTLEDRKHPTLKVLQGRVWKEGYEAGKLKGHIYTDVPEVLKQWKEAGKQLGIYSSGSVQAQKLLFESSDFGNLTPLFSHYFDTTVGNKREVASYQNIQQVLNLPADQILFLSDVEQELDAAKEAGFQTLQLVRDKTVPTKRHPTAPDFIAVARQIT